MTTNVISTELFAPRFRLHVTMNFDPCSSLRSVDLLPGFCLTGGQRSRLVRARMQRQVEIHDKTRNALLWSRPRPSQSLRILLGKLYLAWRIVVAN